MSFRLSVQHVRTLAGCAAIASLGLVALGGYVRGTGAGLSCPDWPLCYGRLIPEDFGGGVAQEVAHRYLASAVSCLVVALSVLGFLNRKKLPRLWAWARILLVVLVAQVILGGLTVLMKLNPFIVTGHLALGTVFFQLLALAALDRAPRGLIERDSVRLIKRSRSTKPSALERAARALAIGVFLQMLLGGFVGSSGASLACPGLLSCSGTAEGLIWSGPQYVQMIHRLLGLSLFVGSIALAIRARKLSGDAALKRGHLFGMATMIAGQMALGISNVYFQIPVAIAVSHLVVAQLILLGYVSYYRHLRPQMSLYAPLTHGNDDEFELGEYTPTKRRFVANFR